MRWAAHSFISFKNIEKIELSSILKLVSNICKSIPDLLVYLGSSFKSSLNPFFAGGGGGETIFKQSTIFGWKIVI